jgi:hypothetical protein
MALLLGVLGIVLDRPRWPAVVATVISALLLGVLLLPVLYFLFC